MKKSNQKKSKGKSNVNQPTTPMIIDDDENIQIPSSSSTHLLTKTSKAKKTNYTASQAEKQILEQLASFQGESLLETLIHPVLESLLQLNAPHDKILSLL